MTPSASEFDQYVKLASPGYADAHIRARDVHPDEGLVRATEIYGKLLPEGIAKVIREPGITPD